MMDGWFKSDGFRGRVHNIYMVVRYGMYNEANTYMGKVAR